MKTHFQPQQHDFQINKGHGRIEKRTVSLTHQLDGIPDFPGLQTLIRVESERQVHRATLIEVSTETRYYVASFRDTAQTFAEQIRGYWGVENKVHYVRDVTQGEDASRVHSLYEEEKRLQVMGNAPLSLGNREFTPKRNRLTAQVRINPQFSGA